MAQTATRPVTRMRNPASSTRPCSRGRIRSQVNNGPVTIYNAAQSWSELPGDRHGVSANASETKPTKILAVFVVDTNKKQLTTPDTLN
jgi:quercetin dioxygenase-like cupin family protein